MKFACKEIKLYDVLKCSFGLNKTSYTVFVSLIKENKFVSIKELIKICKLSSSSVQKALNVLIKKELVLRKKFNMQSGGYFFSYNINNKKNIKEILDIKLNKWFSNVRTEIKRLWILLLKNYKLHNLINKQFIININYDNENRCNR